MKQPYWLKESMDVCSSSLFLLKKAPDKIFFVLVNLYIEKGWPSLDLSLFLALRTNDNQ